MMGGEVTMIVAIEKEATVIRVVMAVAAAAVDITIGRGMDRVTDHGMDHREILKGRLLAL